MITSANEREGGFEVQDLLESRQFTQRASKKRPAEREQAGLNRLMKRFTENHEVILQELVEVTVDSCGADAAGISLEEPDGMGGLHFRWVAAAGSFATYLNGTTPRNYSPCGSCLDRGRPQLFRVMNPYYEFLGVTAEPILDGMLIPWEGPGLRGTIWAVSHKSDSAFDVSDYTTLKRLADLVSVALRHQAHAKG